MSVEICWTEWRRASSIDSKVSPRRNVDVSLMKSIVVNETLHRPATSTAHVTPACVCRLCACVGLSRSFLGRVSSDDTTKRSATFRHRVSQPMLVRAVGLFRVPRLREVAKSDSRRGSRIWRMTRRRNDRGAIVFTRVSRFKRIGTKTWKRCRSRRAISGIRTGDVVASRRASAARRKKKGCASRVFSRAASPEATNKSNWLGACWCGSF